MKHFIEGASGKSYSATKSPAAKQARGNEPGPLYAFVPADGDSRAGAVQEQLGRKWSEGFGLAVLLADFGPENRGVNEPLPHPHGRVNHCALSRSADTLSVRRTIRSLEMSHEVLCVDLTGSLEAAATAILNAAHSIFVVTDSSLASLEAARETVSRLKRAGFEDRVALLLRRSEGGLRLDLAEDVAGAPICGLLETPEQAERLASWLAQPQPVYEQAISA